MSRENWKLGAKLPMTHKELWDNIQNLKTENIEHVHLKQKKNKKTKPSFFNNAKTTHALHL